MVIMRSVSSDCALRAGESPSSPRASELIVNRDQLSMLTTRERDYSFDEIGWLGIEFFDTNLQTLPSLPFTCSLATARKP
jgi:hypothetical protein